MNDNLEINKSPYEIVFSQGVALFNENFPEFIKQFFKGYESVSGAVIPLFSKFEIIGSINMILSDQTSLSGEDMELIISIGLEIGAAIEKIKIQENLRQIEAKNAILLKHIPFSIFRISIDGIIQDAQLEKKIEKVFEITTSTEDFIGRSVYDILPKEIAERALVNIEKTIEMNISTEMKFMLPFKEKQIIFHSDIVPIGNDMVLAFLQNLTRTW